MILGPGAGWPARSDFSRPCRRRDFPRRRLFRPALRAGPMRRARPRTFRGRTPGPEIFFYLVIPLKNQFSYSAYDIRVVNGG